jgi:nicotinate-nucleotide adenylyltransferase
MKVTAIFGGSFDPPHVGHFLAMAAVLALRRADRIVMVPAVRHPFGKGIAPFEDRLRMCVLAAEGLPGGRVAVSDIERRRKLDGRTLSTLRAVRKELPRRGLRLLVGADILDEKDGWHRFGEIERLAPLIVVGRSGARTRAGRGALLPVSDVSSTEVRERLRSGKDCSGLVLPAVLEYIKERGLYT